MTKFFAPLAVLSLLLLAVPAQAQDAAKAGGAPLEITADQTLEWNRNAKQFVARGRARAQQGDMSLDADLLTADYRETAKSNVDIYRLGGEGGVKLESKGGSAAGDKIVYDVATGLATLTGQDLRMTMPGRTITARERFEYAVPEGRLSAFGSVLVVQGDEKMQADSAAAFFTEDPATRRRVLTRLEAQGNVIITTPREVLRGDRGVWRQETNIAELIGSVKVTQGANVLEGARAEVNLTTNQSRMIGGGASSGQRVRGVFYPEKK